MMNFTRINNHLKTAVVIGMCVALGTDLVSIRAADTPTQAAARMALLRNLNQTDSPQLQTAPESGTPSVTSDTQPTPVTVNPSGPAAEPAATPPVAPETAAPAPAAAAVTTTEIAPPDIIPVTVAPINDKPAPANPPIAASAPVAQPNIKSKSAATKAAPAPVSRKAEVAPADPGADPDRHPKTGLSMTTLLLAALAPLMILVAAMTWHRHQRRRAEQPGPAKRGSSTADGSRAGHSGKAAEKIENDILAACASCTLAAIGAVLAGVSLPRPLSVLVAAMFLTVFAFLGGYLMLRALRRFREAQSVRPIAAASAPAVLPGTPKGAKDRPENLNGEWLAAKERQNGSNGAPAVKERQDRSNGAPTAAKERVVRRRKTTSPRPKVRAEER